MSDIKQARADLVARILEGRGKAAPALRRAAFDNAQVPAALQQLVEKVALRAHTITDADVQAARASGLDEDTIFEVVVCAAVGQAVRQHDAALAALAEATRER